MFDISGSVMFDNNINTLLLESLFYKDWNGSCFILEG